MSVSHAVKLKAAIVYLPGIKLLFTDHELTNKNKRRKGKNQGGEYQKRFRQSVSA